MSFVNEYASDEDIEKYKLNDVWDRYFVHEKGNYFRGNRPAFTIDREQEVFLIILLGARVRGGYQQKFLLSINSFDVIVYLNKVDGGSLDLSERPYVIVWSLVKIEKPEGLDVSESVIIDTLKKAITVYGYRGVKKQIPDTLVKFNF